MISLSWVNEKLFERCDSTYVLADWLKPGLEI